MTRIFILTALLTTALATGLASAAPVGTSFSYQGELQDNGFLIDGAVDLRFTMYDAGLAGATIATPLQLNNITVSRGVFTVQLDFGSGVFDGDERWLEIEVRNPHDPGNTQPFILLDPRQPIQPAPYALHAINGGGLWEAVGSSIQNTNTGFVGINRTNLVGSEWFGVHAPVQSGYGGMYVTTEGGTAKPFYGLHTPDNVAWLYLDGASGDVRMNVDGDRMTWTDTGLVGVDVLTPTEKFQVNGTIYSQTGGFKFPDGSVQTTAATGVVPNGSALDASDGVPADAVSVDTVGRTSMIDDLGVGMATSPLHRLHVLEGVGSSNVVHIERTVDATSSSDLLELEMGGLSDASTQFIEAQLSTGDVEFRVWADGDVSMDGVVTTGGADFAELVKISNGASGVEPGDVIVIDITSHRGFAKSTSANSTLVAGIYSTKPGFLGTETDWDRMEAKDAEGESIARKTLDLAKDHNEIPLAMVGIVPCKVSSENGPVRAGDLLVTASEAGHAMRSDNPRAGTIVGKALKDMTGKTDVITVLVTLQ